MACLRVLRAGLQAVHAGAHVGKVLLVLLPPGHLRRADVHARVGPVDPPLDFAAALPGPLLKGLVVGQVEDLGKDLLALRGGAGGEHVCLALEQKGGVHERVVVHVDGVADVLLGLADGVEGDGGEAVAGGDLEFEDRVALAATPRVPPADPVPLRPRGEFEVDGHVRESLVNELVVGARPGLAPEGPGNAIEEGRLAMAVVAAEAGDVDGLQVQLRDVVPVAHEVLDAELEGYQPDVSIFRAPGRRQQCALVQ